MVGSSYLLISVCLSESLSFEMFLWDGQIWNWGIWGGGGTAGFPGSWAWTSSSMSLDILFRLIYIKDDMPTRKKGK